MYLHYQKKKKKKKKWAFDEVFKTFLDKKEINMVTYYRKKQQNKYWNRFYV